MSHAEKVRQVLRRLDRRARLTKEEGLPLEEGRTPLSAEDAPRHRSKKSPGHATVRAVCAAWSQNQPPHSHGIIVAKAVAAELGHLYPHQLNSMMVEALFNKWRSAYAPWTVHSRRGQLKRLLVQLQEFGAMPIKVPRHKQPPPRGVVAQHSEILKALSQAQPDERLLILLCWHLGLRSGEVRNLQIGGIDTANHTITFRRKGGQIKTMPTTPAVDELLAVAIATAITPEQHVCDVLHGKPWSRGAMDMAWLRLKRAAGINPELRLHDIRRTVITDLYEKTNDIRAAQDFAGHESLSSTCHYLAPLGQQKLRELQQLLRFHSEVKQ